MRDCGWRRCGGTSPCSCGERFLGASDARTDEQRKHSNSENSENLHRVLTSQFFGYSKRGFGRGLSTDPPTTEKVPKGRPMRVPQSRWIITRAVIDPKTCQREITKFFSRRRKVARMCRLRVKSLQDLACIAALLGVKRLMAVRRSHEQRVLCVTYSSSVCGSSGCRSASTRISGPFDLRSN